MGEAEHWPAGADPESGPPPGLGGANPDTNDRVRPVGGGGPRPPARPRRSRLQGQLPREPHGTGPGRDRPRDGPSRPSDRRPPQRPPLQRPTGQARRGLRPSGQLPTSARERSPWRPAPAQALRTDAATGGTVPAQHPSRRHGPDLRLVWAPADGKAAGPGRGSGVHHGPEGEDDCGSGRRRSERGGPGQGSEPMEGPEQACVGAGGKRGAPMSLPLWLSQVPVGGARRKPCRARRRSQA